MSHWHPLRLREKSVLRTSRMSTVRGCPPRGLCLAGGISGSTMAHCSSVRSEGYFFRDWSFPHIRAHSSADGTCANYLTNILFCQALFPDSLLHWRQAFEAALRCIFSTTGDYLRRMAHQH